jgi:predicted transcriptional regulator of viral defense system
MRREEGRQALGTRDRRSDRNPAGASRASRSSEGAATEQVKTSSGYIPVSTPEMTAYDLVRYRNGAGSIDHAATVLSELAERMDAKRLLAVARKGEEMPVIQRLGYLLEAGGHAELAADLGRLVERARPRFVRLEPRSPEEVTERNPRWRILVNTTVGGEA